MSTIILQLLGFVVFLAGTIVLGAWLRKNRSKKKAERTSRILHFIFWAAVIPPQVWGVFRPGLTRLDWELGLSPLPRHPAILIIGVLGLATGAYLFFIANIALRLFGEGSNAFRLTRRLVQGNVYERMRNPMSLGYYLGALAIGLLVGSTYITLGTLFVAIPVHIFYLKYFEEVELELRMGPLYLEYRQRVPFLLPKLTSSKS